MTGGSGLPDIHQTSQFSPVVPQAQIPVQTAPIFPNQPMTARLTAPVTVSHFVAPPAGSSPVTVQPPVVDPQGVPQTPVQSPGAQIPVTVQSQIADCPEILGWRQKPGEPQMPRSFTAVGHLRYEMPVIELVNGKLTVQSRVMTAWQIQWSTVCPVCKAAGKSQAQQRYRPVAGFITARTASRLLEVSEDEQRSIIETIIRRRFESGRVGQRHPGCTV